MTGAPVGLESVFESHAHFDDKRFDEDRDLLLGEILPSEGIFRVINAAADMVSSKKGIEMSEKYDYVYSSVGVHPHEVKSMTENNLNELRELAKFGKVVAVGEIGLDYYYDFSPREIQRYWFVRQLGLAAEIGLPVIIHSRDAAAESFEILRNWRENVSGELTKYKTGAGVIHAFSYSNEMAKEYVKMGFYIGVGGVITFKNAKKLVETVADIPLERILIETDCPYLSPEPNRGRRNDSRNLIFIADKIAEIKGISRDEVLCVTKKNSLRLFF